MTFLQVDNICQYDDDDDNRDALEPLYYLMLQELEVLEVRMNISKTYDSNILEIDSNPDKIAYSTQRWRLRRHSKAHAIRVNVCARKSKSLPLWIRT